MDNQQNETAKPDVLSLTADIFSSFVSGTSCQLPISQASSGKFTRLSIWHPGAKQNQGLETSNLLCQSRVLLSPIILFALKTGRNSRVSNDTFVVHSI